MGKTVLEGRGSLEIHGIRVSKAEVARLLGLHRNTVHAMIREDRLPPIVELYFEMKATAKAMGAQ